MHISPMSNVTTYHRSTNPFTTTYCIHDIATLASNTLLSDLMGIFHLRHVAEPLGTNVLFL